MDREHSLGSSEDILRLSGMSSFKIGIALRLAVTETYEITGNSSLHFTRKTTYTYDNQVFQFGQATVVNDNVFGNSKQTVLYGGNGRRLQSTLVQEDGSIFQSMKHILEGDDNRITHIMNYTRGAKKANCVRYLLRA